MSSTISHPGFLTGLLPPGGQLLLSVDSNDGVFLRAMLRWLAETPGHLRIVAFARPGAVSRGTVRNPEPAWTSGLRRALASASDLRLAAFDFVTVSPPGFHLTSRTRNQIGSGVAALRRRGARSLWLLPEGLFSLSEAVKSFDVVAALGGNRQGAYLQVLFAPGEHPPEMFFPRSVSLERESLTVLTPIPPASSGPPSERRKKLEERISFLEAKELSVFDTSPIAQALLTTTKFIRGNEALFRMFPWLKKPSDGEATITQVFTRANSPQLKDLLSRSGPDRTGSGRSGLVYLRAPDRSERSVQVGVVPVPDPLRTLYLCSFEDLTEEREAIRRAEEGERFSRTLAEDVPSAICFERDGKLVFVNRAFLEMFGLMFREEAEGKDLPSFVAPRDRKAAGQLCLPVPDEPGQTREIHLTGIRTGGARFPARVVVRHVDAGGGTGSLWVWIDLSGEERAGQEIRRALADQAHIDRILSVLHTSLEEHDLFEGGLRVCAEELGFESGAVFGREADGVNVGIRAHVAFPEDLQKTFAVQSLQEGLAGYAAKTLEVHIIDLADYPPFLPHRSLFESAQYRVIVLIPLRSGEECAGYLLLCSSRPRDQLALTPAHLRTVSHHFSTAIANVVMHGRIASSEELYRTTLSNVSDTLYRADSAGRLLFLSPQIESLTGYSPQEFLRSPDLWRSIVHPDDRPEYGKRIAASGQEHAHVELEYRLLPKGKAAYRRVRDAVRYTRGQDGAVQLIHGVVSDLSARTGREQTILSSDESRRNILASLQEGVAVVGADFTVVEWSAVLETFTGSQRDALVGRHVEEAPILGGERTALIREAMQGRTVPGEDLAYRKPGTDGESWFRVRLVPLRETAGNIKGVVAVVADVTARKELETEVGESEQTLRHVVDAMGDALMITDLDGKIWEVNLEFTRLSGLRRDEVLGMHFPYPWVTEEDTAGYIRWIGSLADHGTQRDFDMRWKRKDGASVPVSLTATILRNAQGAPAAMLHLTRDMTERHRRDRVLLALNAVSSAIIHARELDEILDVAAAQTREIVGSVCSVIYLREGESRRLALSKASGVAAATIEKILELQVARKKHAQPGDERQPLVLGPGKLTDERVTPSVRRVYKALHLPMVVVVPLQAKGRVLGALLAGFEGETPSPAEGRRLLQLIGNQLGPGIENARLYREVQQQVERITLLYELGKSSTGALDLNTLFRRVHASIVRVVPLSCLSYHELTGEGDSLRLVFEAHAGQEVGDGSAEGAPEHVLPGTVSAKVVHSGRPVAARTPDGRAVLAVPLRRGGVIGGILSVERSTGEPYAPEHLRLLESIGTLVELSIERITLHVDTVAKSLELRQRNRELDDFAYVVSHDLKEPLIAIEGYSKILLAEPGQKLGETDAGYLSTILRSTARLRTMIEDLLTLSRVGRVAGVVRKVPVRAVLQEVLDDMQFTLRDRNATVELPEELPEVMFTRAELGMVFRNLITNGVKFNSRQDPRVVVGVREDPGEFVFSVQDNGIGIEKKDFARVFEVFRRLHVGEAYPGTGAGLTIVRKILEAHGGKVWLESTPGAGSTFFFSIVKQPV